MMKMPEDHPIEARTYTIITRQVEDFMTTVETINEFSIPGMIGYGPSRTGKTVCVKTVVEALNHKHGKELSIMRTVIETHRKGENRVFYEEMCRNLGLRWHKARPSGSELRSLVVNHMIVEGRKKKNKIMLIVDEASKMLVEDFNYLMDIYNRLENCGIRLICVLVGTEKLAKIREELIRSGELQIVGRFMIHSFEFRAVVGVDEIREVLSGLDSYVTYHGRSVTEDVFPENYRQGRRLADEAENIAEAISDIRDSAAAIRKAAVGKRQNEPSSLLQTTVIQMQYLTMAVELILKSQGKYSGDEKWPNKEDWEEALKKSGFLIAMQF